mmetsp:Transcript_20577/g.59717  ORF Transcript_20577/g.59717 Transcript_20577/m.59717 type:complete len:80 (+) Transcript_20577:1163-1402(+)
MMCISGTTAFPGFLVIATAYFMKETNVTALWDSYVVNFIDIIELAVSEQLFWCNFFVLEMWNNPRPIVSEERRAFNRLP